MQRGEGVARHSSDYQIKGNFLFQNNLLLYESEEQEQ
jgi:hypothetical protein